MNKNIRLIIILASLCSFWLVSCTPKIPDEAEIVIISFNDLHGDFQNLPQLSGFVNETRATYKHVIVVDAGDRFTGNPYNDFYEKSQFPIVDILNHIGLDITVIGNHEFDFGVDLLNERIKESTSMAIAANIDLETSGLVGVKPYHIFKKDGIKIAFLGLTNVDSRTEKPATLPERVKDIQFFNPIETALKYGHLRKKSNVFIALTHIGVSEDILLANAMPDLDLIIGGHTHALLEEALIENDVMITQTGSRAGHAGKTKILLKKGVVTNISNELINLGVWDGPIDSVVLKKIRIYEKNPFLQDPFTTLRYGIPTHEQLGHLMTDAALTLPNVDMSVMNCGGIRTTMLPAGPITYADVLRVSPFGNTLVVVDLTPAEIRHLIQMEFSESRSCPLIPGGFEYTVKRLPEGGIEVKKITYPNGKELNETKRYRLALNNYLASKYLSEHTERTVNTDVSVVDNMVEFLRDNPNADYRNKHTRARFN